MKIHINKKELEALIHVQIHYENMESAEECIVKHVNNIIKKASKVELQPRTLHVEVNSDSLAAAHYEKEIAQLRQENERLKEKICDARGNLILGNKEAAFKSLTK